MTDSKEYSTVVNCMKQLEIALKSDRYIAQFLLQQGFITQELYDEVTNPKSNLTETEKAGMLVTAIRNRVELNPRNYHKVVDHLHQNIIRHKDIVEILDQEYHQTTGIGNYFQPGRWEHWIISYVYTYSYHVKNCSHPSLSPKKKLKISFLM